MDFFYGIFLQDIAYKFLKLTEVLIEAKGSIVFLFLSLFGWCCFVFFLFI